MRKGTMGNSNGSQRLDNTTFPSHFSRADPPTDTSSVVNNVLQGGVIVLW